MRYFNGFGLNGEDTLFKEIINSSEYCVSGFSWGAQRAFEYAYDSDKRIDILQLISPAFFQNKNESFIRQQLRFFKKDANSYRDNFIKNCAYPSKVDLKEFSIDTKLESLEELLKYKWDEDKLKEILERGVKIEVYLGDEDIIIDTKEALEFFKPFGEIYYFNNAGHILRSKNE